MHTTTTTSQKQIWNEHLINKDFFKKGTGFCGVRNCPIKADTPASIFTCGRRPAGHVMMSVVGVVGVVVVVVVVVGGEQLLYMGSPRAHVWSYRIQKQNPFFV